jgi:hypothetical protein
MFPSWIVFHVPHDSKEIPSAVLGQFVLLDKDMKAEVAKMTDHYTYEIFCDGQSAERVVRFYTPAEVSCAMAMVIDLGKAKRVNRQDNWAAMNSVKFEQRDGSGLSSEFALCCRTIRHRHRPLRHGHRISALVAQRDKTRSLKQGMMQELLTGRIRLV